MMKQLFVLTIFLAVMHFASADIAIVVNETNEIDDLSKKALLDIYMGRAKSFENKLRTDPIDQPLESQIRDDFYTRLTGKSLAQVNAYWAKLKFTGRHQPPRDEYATLDEILEEVASNPNAIAYVPADSVDSAAVKVVLVLEK
jgi:ABC-type phosphate transport system substrate-binding protein